MAKDLQFDIVSDEDQIKRTIEIALSEDIGTGDVSAICKYFQRISVSLSSFLIIY